MGQLGNRIVNVVLVTLCSIQVASVFNDVSADFLRPGPAAFAAPAAAPAPVERDWAQRKAIIERNLFGAKTAVEFEPEPDPEPDEDLEATKLPLILLGTQVHSVRENSKASVAARGGRGHELLWEGDELASHKGVQLVRIERRRIVLENRGRREELLMAEAGNAPAPSSSPKRASRRRSRRGSRSSEPAPITERLKELRDSAEGRNMGSILSQGRPVPKWENGELVGMELRDIEEGGLYDQVGLSEGDIITAVNGIELNSAADASKVLAELSSGGDLEIETTEGSIAVTKEQLEQLLEEANP